MEYKLIERITALSVATEWDQVKQEWDNVDCEASTEPHTCMCGKRPIYNLCYLLNNKNGNRAMVGNCCVTKFMDMTAQHKVFHAARRGKMNDAAIEMAYSNGAIGVWERMFALDVWRKQKLSAKQKLHYDKINKKVIGHLTDSKNINLNK